MRNPKRTLSAKDVKMGIKNGFTVKDFCTKFNIRGEAGLIEQLERAYPHGGSEQMLREIHQNEKKRRGKVANHSQKGGMKVAKTTKKEVSRLDVLKAQEASLSSEVIKLENKHKALASKHRACLNQARDIQEKVDELMAGIRNYRVKFEEVVVTNNEIVREMNSVSKDRAEKLISLDAIRKEITSLTVITIAVYKDGNFEPVEGSFNTDLSERESEVNILTHQLMDKEICADLTARQIRTLARLLILNTSTPQKIEFIFDNSSLEHVYASFQTEPLSS